TGGRSISPDLQRQVVGRGSFTEFVLPHPWNIQKDCEGARATAEGLCQIVAHFRAHYNLRGGYCYRIINPSCREADQQLLNAECDEVRCLTIRRSIALVEKADILVIETRRMLILEPRLDAPVASDINARRIRDLGGSG